MSSVTDRARQLLVDAALVSEASAMQLVPKTRKPAPGSSEPHVAGQSTFDWMAERFDRCSTDAEWELAVGEAEEALREVRGQVRRKEAMLPPQARIHAWAGSEPRTVAEALNCTPSQVKRWRSAQGLDSETGRPRDRVLLARTLAGAPHNLSQHQIAKRLGVSQATISRDLAA